ncbi:hypothetical protein Baya_3666 [Bagarius yarrelli]|uniref:Armadillo-like helical domain-containing protein 4 n=1 Tax=Bagarius yarrelli TaxID=175774 RepID=A0A556TSK7_BAGYA|nr:hypothetical protein Baya_3666 [Bagarius yarrelli]
MLHCVLLQVLLLVGACFFTWAAPLESTNSPKERRCDRTDRQLRDTSEHPTSPHDDDKMCVIPSNPLPSFPLLQEPRGTAEVLTSIKHKEMRIAVTEGTVEHKIGVIRRSTKDYSQYREVSTKSTEEGSSKEKIQKLIPASPYESISPVDHTTGPDIENTEKELLTSPEAHAEQKVEPSLLAKQLRTDRPAPTHVSLPHSDYTSLSYSDIEKDEGTKARLLKQGEEWDVRRTKDQFNELKSSREILTEAPYSAYVSVSHSYRNINPAVTTLTISQSSNEQTGGSTQKKERVAKENLFTTAEQDKALAPGLLTLSSRLAELGDTWTEPAHLQGVEEASVLTLLQEVGTEATMSSEDLPLIFDDVTPSSSSALASELSVAMAPASGMLGKTELEQTLSMDTDHSPHQSFPGPSDWPSPWQMSGAENLDTVSSSQMLMSGPFSEAAVEHSERTESLQNPDFIPTSVNVHRLVPSPVSATTEQVADIKSTHSAVLKLVSGLEELESQVRSWVKLIREKAGYVSGMLAPVGIGIAGALLIVGALYGIRIIHRKRKNSLKHQRRKQTTEVRSGPDQAMLLADSSEDEF